tara:strand:- start:292 stop:600 length:309 start_codon:yes stop_codon:yes gene_type:complete
MVEEVSFEGFGWREIGMANDLLTAMFANKQTQFFDDFFNADPSELKIGFNSSSGNVWLQDEDYNVAMLNNDELDIFFTDFETGEEGFFDELSVESQNRILGK